MRYASGMDVKNGEAGFALVLTLVVILALSLLTEVMTRWVLNALDQALAHREEVDARPADCRSRGGLAVSAGRLVLSMLAA